tara:strand:+ start:645 stop:1655 length:1011 start_codon:yes stop_codon:yes gene_type:complete
MKTIEAIIVAIFAALRAILDRITGRALKQAQFELCSLRTDFRDEMNDLREQLDANDVWNASGSLDLKTERLDALEGRIDANLDAICELDPKADDGADTLALTRRIDDNERRIDVIDCRANSDRFACMAEDISGLECRLDDIESVDADDIEHRLSTLEENSCSDDVETRLTDLECTHDIDTHERRLDELEAQAGWTDGSALERIAALESPDGGFSTIERIQNIERSTVADSVDLDKLEARIAKLEARAPISRDDRIQDMLITDVVARSTERLDLLESQQTECQTGPSPESLDYRIGTLEEANKGLGELWHRAGKLESLGDALGKAYRDHEALYRVNN